MSQYIYSQLSYTHNNLSIYINYNYTLRIQLTSSLWIISGLQYKTQLQLVTQGKVCMRSIIPDLSVYLIARSLPYNRKFWRG